MRRLDSTFARNPVDLTFYDPCQTSEPLGVFVSMPISMPTRYQQTARHTLRIALVIPFACLLTPALSTAAEPAATMGSGCAISEFRSGALLTHAPAERKTFAVAWLKKNIDNCSIAQLKAIVDNRPNWMGTADTGDVAQLIDSVLERRTGGNTNAFYSPNLPTPRPGSTGAAQVTAIPAPAAPRPVLAQPPLQPNLGNPQQPAPQQPVAPAPARK